MAISLEEVYQHYNSLDPLSHISKNTPDGNIVTVTFSQFKAINKMVDVRMAEFKFCVFDLFPEIANIVSNNNIVIRLNKKEDYLEGYDVMLINLDEDKIQAVLSLFQENKLIDAGYKLLVVTFIMPKSEAGEDGSELVTMMFKYCPENENPNEFFGYII